MGILEDIAGNITTKEVHLYGTLFHFKRGLEANLPKEAPEGEPLLSMGPGRWKLWAGAGPGNPIQLLSGGGGGGGASFTIINSQVNPKEAANDYAEFNNKFVMFNPNTALWERAYAGFEDETETSFTSLGFVTKNSESEEGDFTITMLGEVVCPIVEGMGTQSLLDINGNNLIPGEYYFLTQNSSNPGLCQIDKPTFGVVQLVLQCISVDETDGTRVILMNSEAYDTGVKTYGGQQTFIFNDSALSDYGDISFIHSLETDNLSVVVYNNEGEVIIPDKIQTTGSNTVTISLHNFYRPIIGTWRVLVMGGTNPNQSVGGRFNSYTTTFDSRTNITVNHNLGTESVVMAIYDSTGLLIQPYKTKVVDLNTVSLQFDKPISGKIVISGNGIGTYTGIDFKTTDDIPQGTKNKYFSSDLLMGLLNQLVAENTVISDWLLVNTGSTYTFTHNLNTQNYDIDFYVTDSLGHVVKGCVNQSGGEGVGVSILTQGVNDVTFCVGDSALFSIKSGTTILTPTTGRVQVIVKKRTLT